MILLGVFVLAAMPACGTGGDRPTDAEWRATWEQDRLLMPDVDTLLAGGSDLCGDLIGQFRVSLPDLTPTPTEALDDAVDAWVAHAESIVFDCPDDRAELSSRIEVLDVLAAEIDAGLAADILGYSPGMLMWTYAHVMPESIRTVTDKIEQRSRGL